MSAKAMEVWLKALFAFGITQVASKHLFGSPPHIREIKVAPYVPRATCFNLSWSRGRSSIRGEVEWVDVFEGLIITAVVRFCPPTDANENLFRTRCNLCQLIMQEQLREVERFLEV